MSLSADLHRLIISLAEASSVEPDWMRNRLRSMPLSEMAALVAKLPPNVKAGLSNLPSLAALLGPGRWTPSPGPQTLAYESPADVLGYGGALVNGLENERNDRAREEVGILAEIVSRKVDEDDAAAVHLREEVDAGFRCPEDPA